MSLLYRCGQSDSECRRRFSCIYGVKHSVFGLFDRVQREIDRIVGVRLGPYGFPYLAAVLSRLLNKIGVGGPVDVLGLSWGGALAQQFAFQNPRSCRRLILVSTGTGMGMVPGKPAVLVKMATTRRFRGPRSCGCDRG